MKRVILGASLLAALVGVVGAQSIQTGQSPAPASVMPAGPSAGNVLPAGSGGTGSGTVPTAGQVPVGNAGGTAYAPMTLSGSGATFSLSSAGVLTISAIADGSLSSNVPLKNAANTFSAAQTMNSVAVTSASVPVNGMYLPTANALSFATNTTSRATISANGVLHLGTFSSDLGILQVEASASGAYYPAYIRDSDATSALQILMRFDRGPAQVGSIRTTDIATTFVTTSDARMKVDRGMAKDLSRLWSLKVHDFAWKKNGSIDRGVFAQEAAPLYPTAVAKGKSEAVTAAGLPVDPWGVDYSKFVADLIVAVQQQQARIVALEADVAALRAKK